MSYYWQRIKEYKEIQSKFLGTLYIYIYIYIYIHIHAQTGCLNIHGTYVTANNSTNNVVFFFLCQI